MSRYFMAIDSDSPARRPFLQRNCLPIAFGILLLAILGVATTLRQQAADQGILEPLQSFLDQLAAASPAAKSTLQAYYTQFRRDSVAAKDVLPLCSTMKQQ